MLKQKMNSQNSEKKANLLGFMTEKGFQIQDWFDKEETEMSNEVINALHEFFAEEVAVAEEGTVVDGSSALKTESSNDGIDFEKIKELAQLGKTTVEDEKVNASTEDDENGKVTDTSSEKNETPTDKNGETPKDEKTETPKETGKGAKKGGKKNKDGESKTQLKRKYKIDNLIQNMDNRELELENVRYVCNTGADEIYSTEINGLELANMWLEGKLVFDPTMQRGIKQDAKGVDHANFNERHIKDLYNSIISGRFTPTQIHFAIVTDDTDSVYYEEDMILEIAGRIRLLDGQHRVRGFAKVLGEILAEELSGFEVTQLEKFVFNIQIHVTTADFARVIYNNIDQNLKLDKSQKKQLQNDYYARIVNALNLNTDSAMLNKISNARPVRNKLVLFNTLTDAIEENWKGIQSNTQKTEVQEYLLNFFDYLVSKNTDAFGKSEDLRKKFRETNLLNENNAFKMWVNVAYAMKDMDWKSAIDILMANADVFNKSNKYWTKKATVKPKQAEDSEGFAMNNTSSGINAITTKAFEILGIKSDKYSENVKLEVAPTDDKTDEESTQK